MAYNVSLEEISVLEVLFLPLDTDVQSLGACLKVGLSSFDLLNRTTEDMATILAFEDPDDEAPMRAPINHSKKNGSQVI